MSQQFRDIKVLFLCKKRMNNYASNVGLVNSANLANIGLNNVQVLDRDIICKSVVVVDGNGVDKEIYDFKPTHVIIEALWVTPEKIQELMSRYPRAVFVIRLHSKIPFLAYEGNAFDWITRYLLLAAYSDRLYIAPNTQELTDSLHISFPASRSFITLSNLYPANPNDKALFKDKILDWIDSRVPDDNRKVRIGCFGAMRPMKNQLLQAIAAIYYADQQGCRLRFYINASRKEQQGDSILKNLRALFAANKRHKLKEIDWLGYDEFKDLVSTMDINMQVSMTETFNIVSADSVSSGVPVVGSPEISWLPSQTQANPSKVVSIISTIADTFRNYHTILNLSQKGLYEAHEEAIKQWSKFLTSTI